MVLKVNQEIPIFMEDENGEKECPYLEVYEETHRKKNKDGTRGDWAEPRARIAYNFKKNIEAWRQTQPTSEDGTMVQPSPEEMNNMWTAVVGGSKKGRTYGTGVLQSSSTPLFSNSSSTLFAKFDKLEELVKKNMPQLFRDEEDNESDDN
ncbi:hypothetical protein P3S68_024945 [Capsicum galapagoense]